MWNGEGRAVSPGGEVWKCRSRSGGGNEREAPGQSRRPRGRRKLAHNPFPIRPSSGRTRQKGEWLQRPTAKRALLCPLGSSTNDENLIFIEPLKTLPTALGASCLPTEKKQQPRGGPRVGSVASSPPLERQQNPLLQGCCFGRQILTGTATGMGSSALPPPQPPPCVSEIQKPAPEAWPRRPACIPSGRKDGGGLLGAEERPPKGHQSTS